MASQWTQTFALVFIGVFLLLAFFEVGGACISRLTCTRARAMALRHIAAMPH